MWRLTRGSKLAVSCALVVLGCAGGAIAPASSSGGDVHSAGFSVPDLTGAWRNQKDPTSAPAWQLKASNGRQTLDANWRGSTTNGHPDLRGSFHTTLTAATTYTGRYTVTEDAPPTGGDMTVKVDSATQIEFTLQPDNGGQAQKYIFVRVGGAPPPPTALIQAAGFDQTVSAPEPDPGGNAAIESPPLRAVDQVSVDVSGLSADDLAVLAAARHQCYVNFVRQIVVQIGARSTGIEVSKTFDEDVPFVLVGLQAELGTCLAFVDAVEFVASGGATPASAAASSCGISSAKLSFSKFGRSPKLKSFKFIGKKSRLLSVSCKRTAGGLHLTVASKAHVPLKKIVGSKLGVGIARSSKDSAGGQLTAKFHKG